MVGKWVYYHEMEGAAAPAPEAPTEEMALPSDPAPAKPARKPAAKKPAKKAAAKKPAKKVTAKKPAKKAAAKKPAKKATKKTTRK